MVDYDVLVIGGGNAALCAALAARDAGRSVLVIERAPKTMRGGNSRHTRNFRETHRGPDAYVTGPYLPDELLADLIAVTGHEGDATLTRILVDESIEIARWAADHGVYWQAPLRGTLSLARTNRFFLGGGKALVNAYYRWAEHAGIAVSYETKAVDVDIDGQRCTGVIVEDGSGRSSISARSVVVASGGFEANRSWLRRHWGDAADNFVIRGTPFNDGLMVQRLFDHGAIPVADPTRFHAIAVDARGPREDGGIITRLDAIPFGICVNRDAARFHDEGEEIWPKRYAIWGRLLAEQPGQTASVILDAKTIESFMAPLYPPAEAATIGELGALLGLDPAALETTVAAYNRSVVSGGTYTPGELDDCRTEGLEPAKSHWALPIDTPPYYGFPLRPGITFTYHGVRIDAAGRVVGERGPFENLYAAGEVMAGNILTRGYLGGIGMTIGTVFGRLAGRGAARHD